MKKLIDNLISEGYLKTPAIIQAFRQVNRTDFLLPGERSQEELEAESEINAPLPIDEGQTISQPLTVAFMLELLQVRTGDRVLDVGSGSGWVACLLAKLAGSAGRVIALERILKLKKFGEANARKYIFHNLKFIHGDGARGYPAEAPYDKIHVAAAAKSIPQFLIDQLAKSGKMVIPVGVGLQDMVQISKSPDGTITEKRFPGFVFVPLVESKE
ncbi:MAG: protein-L-isoaspartate O-methyltransferase [Patescibacteria group bacterium]|nr:protein-L-isoaspartate O-methyltransferase [Patescibacteria group bacterium]